MNSSKDLSPLYTESEDYFRIYHDQHEGAVVIEEGREIIAMNSTAYVPLFRHPAVVAEVTRQLPKHGVGAGSRYNMGHIRVVRDLEEKIAALTGTEEAVIFPSGYNVNLAVDSPAFGENPFFIADQRNHPSILSGIRLAAARSSGGNWGANCVRYLSNDMGNLESFLDKNQDRANRWILTVGTYGPLGQRADLPGIVRLAEKYQSRVYLDDVHFFWVYGPNLCGLADHCGLKTDILMGSFKAFGMPGAFAAGRKEIIAQLRFSEAYIFSIGLLPILSVAALAAIEVIYSDEGRALITRLWHNARLLADGLQRAGFELISDGSTQMVCFRIDGEDRAMAFANLAKQNGVLVQPYFHPAVPRGGGHIRLTPIATHTELHIAKTIDVLCLSGRKTGII